MYGVVFLWSEFFWNGGKQNINVLISVLVCNQSSPSTISRQQLRHFSYMILSVDKMTREKYGSMRQEMVARQ